MTNKDKQTWSDYKVKKINIEQIPYSERFSRLSDAPESLYYRGQVSVSTLKNCIAVVGSRRMSRYGRLVTENIVSALVSSGVTIISGFMYGIDTVAHQIAVDQKGRTIAVFGCGINQIYPLENDKLYTSILKHGGIVCSEYIPEQKPKMWMYTRRNRIVAALANLGVVVIEASVKSGSLITANYASKLQRTIYAVPGPVNSSTSEGTNWLIKTGKAKMITSAEDICDVENRKKLTTITRPLSPVESKIFKILKLEGTPLALDEIVILSGLKVSEISTQISIMHLKGVLEEIGGKYALKQ